MWEATIRHKTAGPGFAAYGCERRRALEGWQNLSATVPGLAARVIEPPPGLAPPKFPFLVESLVLRSRWWVNEFGEPDNIHSPLMKTPASRGLHAENNGALRHQPARWIRS